MDFFSYILISDDSQKIRLQLSFSLIAPVPFFNCHQLQPVVHFQEKRDGFSRISVK
jgi:hypothetical protein